MEIRMDQPLATGRAFDPQLHLFCPELVYGTHIWYLLPDVCHIQRYMSSPHSIMTRFSRKTLPDLFTHTYGFSTGASGLAYLGLGTGFISAAVFGARFSDKVYAYYRAKNNGIGKPEMRIPALIIGSLFIPVGLLCV